MFFLALWAYRTLVKDATEFTPFQLVYGLEATLLIECEIPSLKIVVELLPNTSPEEEHLLYLERLDETHCFSTLVIEAQKKVGQSSFLLVGFPSFLYRRRPYPPVRPSSR